MEWLGSKSDDETEKLVSEARKEMPQLRKKFKMRQKGEKREKLFERQQARERANANRLQEQELITLSICYYGLWQNTEQVDSMLDSLKTKTDKIAALKAQVRFRKEILKQDTGDTSAFSFSKVVAGKSPANSGRAH